MAYNIESLIQRGNAQVSLNVVGGELTVTLKAIDPTVADAEAVVINRELLRDVQATLSNNNYPTTGYCEITNGANDGELVITAPSNMPLLEGENLIVLSGVYCGAMFVQTYSVTGVASGSATASAAITLNIIGSTPAAPEPQEQLVTEGTGINEESSPAFQYDPENASIMCGVVAADGEISGMGYGSITMGYAETGDGRIRCGGNGAIAMGLVGGESPNGGMILANHNGCIAAGVAYGAEQVVAYGEASQAFGRGVVAQSDCQMAIGKFNEADSNGNYVFIVGNGSNKDTLHNAFAIGRNGSLFLFQADGTPIELTPAKLAALVA